MKELFIPWIVYFYFAQRWAIPPSVGRVGDILGGAQQDLEDAWKSKFLSWYTGKGKEGSSW